jgi:hypothetical protein
MERLLYFDDKQPIHGELRASHHGSSWLFNAIYETKATATMIAIRSLADILLLAITFLLP